MRQQSAKRARERDTRNAVVADVEADCGRRCTASGLLPGHCWGHRDAHEIIARSLRPGSHLERDLILLVCRAHHDYIGEHITEARAAGFYFSAWELDEARYARVRLADRARRGRW